MLTQTAQLSDANEKKKSHGDEDGVENSKRKKKDAVFTGKYFVVKKKDAVKTLFIVEPLSNGFVKKQHNCML